MFFFDGQLSRLDRPAFFFIARAIAKSFFFTTDLIDLSENSPGQNQGVLGNYITVQCTDICQCFTSLISSMFRDGIIAFILRKYSMFSYMKVHSFDGMGGYLLTIFINDVIVY